MIPKAYPSPQGSGDGGARLGVDVGATLAKLVVLRRDGSRELRLLPSSDTPGLASEIAALAPERVGLTGGGATRLAERLAFPTSTAGEFTAWAAGARTLLGDAETNLPDRYLLVSVGTGTSAMLVNGENCVRAGGTALGGGTVTGLASALVGSSDFDTIARLADDGDRRRVDLMVRDIYSLDESPLPGDLNASSFAKLGRNPGAPDPDRRDLAHAIMALVGENVALICGGLAAAAGVELIVYGGSTLRNNRAITDILEALALAVGCRAAILADGEFAGALGALELAPGQAT